VSLGQALLKWGHLIVPLIRSVCKNYFYFAWTKATFARFPRLVIKDNIKIMQSSHLIQFNQLYNTYKDPLYAYALKITRSGMLAEDIVQDVFLKLHDQFPFIREFSSIEIWIFTSARNRIFSHFRKKAHRFDSDPEQHQQIATEHSFIEEIERKELITCIESELEKMAPEQSEPFYLKEYACLSYKEIATVMDISEDLVKSRICKVRQRLRKILLPLEKD
jgi:RNA polymerase sigma-70 factor (ECF subfamily)